MTKIISVETEHGILSVGDRVYHSISKESSTIIAFEAFPAMNNTVAVLMLVDPMHITDPEAWRLKKRKNARLRS